jgi:hypothetical protein
MRYPALFSWRIIQTRLDIDRTVDQGAEARVEDDRVIVGQVASRREALLGTA